MLYQVGIEQSGDRDRPVLAAGTADADDDLALTLLFIQRDGKVDEGS